MSKILEGFCSVVSMHSGLCLRKQVMSPFISNVFIIVVDFVKIGLLKFLMPMTYPE